MIDKMPEFSKKYHDLYEDSSYHIIDGASHCFTKVEYRKQVQELIVDFIKEN